MAFLKKETLFIDQKYTSWKRAKKFGHGWTPLPPLIRAMPERKHFFFIDVFPKNKVFFNIFYISFCRHFESCDFCFLIIHNLPCLVFCLCPDFVDCHEYWYWRTEEKGGQFWAEGKLKCSEWKLLVSEKYEENLAERKIFCSFMVTITIIMVIHIITTMISIIITIMISSLARARVPICDAPPLTPGK